MTDVKSAFGEVFIIKGIYRVERRSFYEIYFYVIGEIEKFSFDTTSNFLSEGNEA